RFSRIATLMPKPRYQARGVAASAGAATMSVTCEKVLPPSTSGARNSGFSGSSMTGIVVIGSAQLRVRVADLREVGRARLGVELGEHAVVQHARLQPRDDRVPVEDVAEGDRLGRAGLLAGGLDLAVTDAPAVELRLQLAGVDALHAVGALLHHAARADGDV